VPGNLEPGALIDDAVQVTDPEALEQVFDLQMHEGISVGGSAGASTSPRRSGGAAWARAHRS
jgi:cysteine synthase